MSCDCYKTAPCSLSCLQGEAGIGAQQMNGNGKKNNSTSVSAAGVGRSHKKMKTVPAVSTVATTKHIYLHLQRGLQSIAIDLIMAHFNIGTS